MKPELVSKELSRIAAKIDKSKNPSVSLVKKDIYRLNNNMKVSADGPVSLTTDGEISMYDIDVKYEFFNLEKKQNEDFAMFGLRFILGSDLEERMTTGKIGVNLTKLELNSYLYRNAELSMTGPPGGIKGDPELNRFGLLPNIITKCFKDAMSKMGLSSLKGMVISDEVFHP